MRRFVFAALGALLLVSVGCNFNARLAQYCENSGNCTCDQGMCCANPGAVCSAGADCCSGSDCRDGVCSANLPHMTAQALKDSFAYVLPGKTDSTEVVVRNDGFGATAGPLDFALTGDVDAFSLDVGTCAGTPLGAGSSCRATIVYHPQQGGTFHTTLTVTSGDQQAQVSLTGVSEAAFRVLFSNAGAEVHVVSDPAGIDCTGLDSCQATLPLGPVSLTVSHTAGTDFSDSDPGCTGTLSCSINFNFDAPFTALLSFRPWLGAQATGPGGITSDVGGLDCGLTCFAVVSGPVKLFANANPGATFLGWSGACQSAGTATECDLNLTGPVSVYAAFQ